MQHSPNNTHILALNVSRPEQVSLNIFDLIDSICQDFRAELKQRQAPALEKWLTKVPEEAQGNLFHNLLETEIAWRRRCGEQPSSDEYLQRFPQFARQVRKAFDEQTLLSLDARHSTPHDGITGSLNDESHFGSDELNSEYPAASRLGDYELVRELGRGGMGVVYEAKHLKRGNRVALKTLPTGVHGQEINADRLHNFRREFRSLAEINHSNLVGMQTLEVDGSQWFFTMDLIEGTEFLNYVRPQNRLDEVRLRSALKQLAVGIIFLHENGIVHRDLKPSNVLVEPDGRVLILDFGLVAQLQHVGDATATGSAMFAGTPRYAAPEQMFGERTEATDWYAFGTMLYEALAGHPPFTASSQVELLQNKQRENPLPLAGRNEVDQQLAKLAEQLLKREPELRPNARQVAETLQLESGTSAPPADPHRERTGVLTRDDEPLLIGREKQLAQLEEARQAWSNNNASAVVWIIGKSGEGKSSLARKFLSPFRSGGQALVFSGRCYDRESVPFKALDCLMEPLAQFLKSWDADEIGNWLPTNTSALARIFPALRRVPQIDNMIASRSAPPGEKYIRDQAFSAFRQLLVSIGQQIPIILFVDDLQWGDADSCCNLLEPVATTRCATRHVVGQHQERRA